MEKVRPSKPCSWSQKTILEGHEKIKNFNLPLSECEIIDLHSILLTPRQHVIKTQSVSSGRALIQTMLQSLSYYQRVGCLTTLSKFQIETVLDIYPILQKDAQVYGLGHAIEQFFVDYKNIDFIWVEQTDDLLTHMGFKYIEHLCKILTKNQTIPVIVLQYEN